MCVPARTEELTVMPGTLMEYLTAGPQSLFLKSVPDLCIIDHNRIILLSRFHVLDFSFVSLYLYERKVTAWLELKTWRCALCIFYRRDSEQDVAGGWCIVWPIHRPRLLQLPDAFHWHLSLGPSWRLISLIYFRCNLMWFCIFLGGHPRRNSHRVMESFPTFSLELG